MQKHTSWIEQQTQLLTQLSESEQAVTESIQRMQHQVRCQESSNRKVEDRVNGLTMQTDQIKQKILKLGISDLRQSVEQKADKSDVE